MTFRIVITIVIFFLISSCAKEDTYGELTIHNQSGETIDCILVKIFNTNKFMEMCGIVNNTKITFNTKVDIDSHYDINVMFSSGKNLKKSVGYLTSGLKTHDAILIKPNSIAHQSTSSTLVDRWFIKREKKGKVTDDSP